MAGLLLRAIDSADRWHWRWLLTDELTGVPLADHTVAIDPASSDAEAFSDLHWYMRWHCAGNVTSWPAWSVA